MKPSPLGLYVYTIPYLGSDSDNSDNYDSYDSSSDNDEPEAKRQCIEPIILRIKLPKMISIKKKSKIYDIVSVSHNKIRLEQDEKISLHNKLLLRIIRTKIIFTYYKHA